MYLQRNLIMDVVQDYKNLCKSQYYLFGCAFLDFYLVGNSKMRPARNTTNNSLTKIFDHNITRCFLGTEKKSHHPRPPQDQRNGRF